MALLRTAPMMTTPEHDTMKFRILLFSLWLLTLTTSAWGQAVPVVPETLPARPLNLSLPREMLRSAPVAFQADTDDTATRNLRPGGSQQAERLPYGSGYEARQRGMTSGAGGPSGGGVGRGGRGRGR